MATTTLNARPLDMVIADVSNGYIPCTVPLEDMCRMAPRFGHGARYVIRQIVNLGLDKKQVEKLHEICGYDSTRMFKILLAYEYNLVHRHELQAAITADDDVSPYTWETLVNDILDADQRLDLSSYVG